MKPETRMQHDPSLDQMIKAIEFMAEIPFDGVLQIIADVDGEARPVLLNWKHTPEMWSIMCGYMARRLSGPNPPVPRQTKDVTAVRQAYQKLKVASEKAEVVGVRLADGSERSGLVKSLTGIGRPGLGGVTGFQFMLDGVEGEIKHDQVSRYRWKQAVAR